jgi:hypothetical protein
MQSHESGDEGDGSNIRLRGTQGVGVSLPGLCPCFARWDPSESQGRQPRRLSPHEHPGFLALLR